MKKIFFIILASFALTITYAQNKKEQIAQLTFSRDSLTVVLGNERNNSNTKVIEFNSTIEQQKNTIVQLTKEFEIKQNELTANHVELEKQLKEMDRLTKLLIIKTKEFEQLKAIPSSDYLVTNNSAGYFKIGGSWQNFAKNNYAYKSVQGFGTCTDACCDGGFNLGTVISNGKDGQTIEKPEITIGALDFGKSKSKTEHKGNPNVFYISSANCNGWYWKDKINYIIIYSEIFKTKEGIGVGSTLEELQEKLGKLQFYVGWIEEQENALQITVKSYPNIQFILDVDDYKGNWEDISLKLDKNSFTISNFKKDTKIKRLVVDHVN